MSKLCLNFGTYLPCLWLQSSCKLSLVYYLSLPAPICGARLTGRRQHQLTLALSRPFPIHCVSLLTSTRLARRRQRPVKLFKSRVTSRIVVSSVCRHYSFLFTGSMPGCRSARARQRPDWTPRCARVRRANTARPPDADGHFSFSKC